jgi:hypothetical protein
MENGHTIEIEDIPADCVADNQVDQAENEDVLG